MTVPGRWRPGRRVLLGGLVVLCVVAGTMLAQRSVWLTWVGSLMVVEDELTAATAIVPLAGGRLDREVEAAELLRQGWADRLLLTQEQASPAEEYLRRRGVSEVSDLERRLRLLSALGVPREQVTVLEGTVRSTRDEAERVAWWVEAKGGGQVIVVTSAFHTARARYVFERTLQGRGVTVSVRPSQLGSFHPDSWWMRQDTLRVGLIELQKLLVYRLWY